MPGMIMELGGPDDEVETLSVDISEKDVKKLKVGQGIELKVLGIVGRLEVDPRGEGEPRMSMKVDSKSIKIVSDDQTKGIQSLAKDDDDDNDDEDELEEVTLK